MHMLICVTFSLPPGVRGLAAASACGSSWTFLFAFYDRVVYPKDADVHAIVNSEDPDQTAPLGAV